MKKLKLEQLSSEEPIAEDVSKKLTADYYDESEEDEDEDGDGEDGGFGEDGDDEGSDEEFEDDDDGAGDDDGADGYGDDFGDDDGFAGVYGEGGDVANADSQYDGDTWGVWNGKGSPASPMDLKEVAITNASTDDAWSSLAKVVVGITEMVSGVVVMPETGGAGVYLIIDGFGRTGLNLANFINEVEGNDTSALPTNFGGLIGMGFSNEQGAYWGGVANDTITALVDGGIYPDTEEAIQAIIDSNWLQAIASGNVANDDYNTMKEFFESYKSHL